MAEQYKASRIQYGDKIVDENGNFNITEFNKYKSDPETYDVVTTVSDTEPTGKIDLTRISTTAAGALNGNFISESRIHASAFENATYEQRSDGSYIIKSGDTIIGFTDAAGILGKQDDTPTIQPEVHNYYEQKENVEAMAAATTDSSEEEVVSEPVVEQQEYIASPTTEEIVSEEPVTEEVASAPAVEETQYYVSPTAEVIASEASTAEVVSETPTVEPDKTTGENYLNTATNWLDTPYKYGGTSTSGIDCSGFTQAAAAAVGVELPRTTGEQIKCGQHVEYSDLRVGDLVFTNGGKHVVIFAGYDEDGNALTLGASTVKEKVAYVKLENQKPIYEIRRVDGLS